MAWTLPGGSACRRIIFHEAQPIKSHDCRRGKTRAPKTIRGDGPQKHWLSKDLVRSLDDRETAVDALIKLANRALHAEPAVRREVGPVQQKSADARSGPAAKWSSTEGWSLPVDRGK